jgi:hypothetical protein
VNDDAPVARRLPTILPALLTAMLVLVVLWWSLARQGQEVAPSAEPAPQSTIWRLVEASRAADVDAYLGCFSGGLLRSLEAIRADFGENDFGDYLRQSHAELKGIAVYDIEHPSPGRAALTVEQVYASENERQRLELALIGAEWKIIGAAASRRRQALIPYGTPIEEVDSRR